MIDDATTDYVGTAQSSPWAEHYTPTASERSEIPERILKLLKQCNGKSQAIPAWFIAKEVGLHGKDAARKARAIISDLRKQGHMIAATLGNPIGFFMISNQDESDAYAKFLYNKKVEIDELYRDWVRNSRKQFAHPLPGIDYPQEVHA